MENIDYKQCPISFGDCPDCEFWIAGECTHKDDKETEPLYTDGGLIEK